MRDGRPGQVASLLAGGLVHDLPALGPGDSTIMRTEAGKPLRDALVRMAMARTEADRVAALWELDLGGVADVAIRREGMAPADHAASMSAYERGRRDRPAAMTGLALAVAVAAWWLTSTRLALDHGTDAGRSAADALNALWLVRGMALAMLGVRAGALHGWRRGATAGLGLIAPSWPLVALAWSASATSLTQVALAELLLLAGSVALPLIGLFLRRSLRSAELAVSGGNRGRDRAGGGVVGRVRLCVHAVALSCNGQFHGAVPARRGATSSVAERIRLRPLVWHCGARPG